jgi:hypothetical protein
MRTAGCALRVAAVLTALLSSACAGRMSDRAGPGIVPCRTGRVVNYMAAEAQQCWYLTAQGRWRIVNHEFHYDVLVMQTQASTPALTDQIVRQLAEVHGERFVEILVYVQPDPGGAGTIVRRARWTRNAAVEYLDFPAS